MPYVEPHEREGLVVLVTPTTVGQLNYTITKLCHEWIQAQGTSYVHLNEVVGVLECAKLELYRMVAAPYEDKKRAYNGPVSTLDSQETK